MSRRPRIQLAGGLYHVTARGVVGTSIFPGDADCEFFLLLLGRVVRRLGWLCHSYCLMGTHYHLLVETPMPNLAHGVQRLNGVYARTFNRVRARPGHLFEARYHAVLIEKESHLLEVARYIVLNPSRAGICDDPGGWLWSSYRATAGLGRSPGFLTIDWLLGQFSASRAEAHERYRAFVADGLGRAGWRPPSDLILGRPEFMRRYVGSPQSGEPDPGV